MVFLEFTRVESWFISLYLSYYILLKMLLFKRHEIYSVFIFSYSVIQVGVIEIVPTFL